MIFDDVIENLNILLNGVCKPETLFAIFLCSLYFLEVAKNKLLYDGFDLLYNCLDIFVIYFIIVLNIDGIYFIVIFKVQIGRNEFYLMADGIDLSGQLLFIIDVTDG